MFTICDDRVHEEAPTSTQLIFLFGQSAVQLVAFDRMMY